MIAELVLLVITMVLFHHWYKRPKGMPPGPRTIPFLGSGMVTDLKKSREYQKKYGDIFRCELGTVKIIYICEYKLAKEALSKLEIADRPSFEGFHFMTDGKEAGVILSNGQRWQNVRRFLLRNLRDLGMGKSFLDEAIIQEAKFLVEDLKTHAGTPTLFPDAINIAVLNVVWQMVANRRYDLHDEEINNFVKILKAMQDDTVGFVILELFPVFKKILPKVVRDKLFRLERINTAVLAARKLFTDIVNFHKEKLDREHAKCVIDEYLVQMEEKTDASQFFNEMDLMKTSFDLFGAGFDTTSNMLRWMCLYAAKYPEVQRIVQQQIDEVLPREEFPANKHKAQLPLLEAFIHEVLRLSSLIPFGVMRATNNEVYLAGYYIPKGAIIFGAGGVSHYDPRYWETPEEFRLERFLDKEGNFMSQKEGFLAFGIGRRSCLGESLARMELSIFTAALLQNFTFSPPKGKSIDLSPDSFPLSNFAKDQELLITIRQ